MDPVVQCPCILALAQVCVRAPQDLLPPLGDLSLQLLQVPQGARQLACACVLTATLVVRGLKGVFTEKAPRRLLMALDQYRSQSSACDYNNLRLMAGYVLCALLVHDPNAQVSPAHPSPVSVNHTLFCAGPRHPPGHLSNN